MQMLPPIRTRRPAATDSPLGPDTKFQVFTERQLDLIPHLDAMPDEERFAMRVVASVLPFRVNRYVIDQLIDWNRVPDDPIFRLTFPQREMLAPEDFDRIADLLRRQVDGPKLRQAVDEVRAKLNPHPSGQMDLNVPMLDGARLKGMQHKYRETVLFFPSQGQTCHAYCTFCFRWAQFVGVRDLRFASSETAELHHYLRSHTEVTDLLLTGGDPMVMKTSHLAAYIEPLLAPEFEHIQHIRIGTKSLSYWPYRFISDTDSYDLLRLFERVGKAGKQLSFMAHFNHWQEMEPHAAREAIRRIRDTGAVIRSQSPLVAHINDDPSVWSRMWKEQTTLGVIPYYMFVERDTGAKHYFALPLARAAGIYREAIQGLSGLARTARGPVMSATPGKVEIQGVAEVAGEKVFVLRFIQARNPEWVQQPFFARFDPHATWFDDLRPAFGASRFFFEQ